MIRRPPRSTRTDTLFPTRRSSDPPARPCGEHREDRQADRQRHPAAIGHLDEIGPEIGDVDDEEDREHRQRLPRDRKKHTSELQSLMRISYAVFCLKKNNHKNNRQKKMHTPADRTDTAMEDT